ncbi:MAG: hypothetical protein KGN01_06440 [Patescibacteria group bacterium]|nr:hypothetical protein [Patescibacteria group bacterium]
MSFANRIEKALSESIEERFTKDPAWNKKRWLSRKTVIGALLMGFIQAQSIILLSDSNRIESLYREAEGHFTSLQDGVFESTYLKVAIIYSEIVPASQLYDSDAVVLNAIHILRRVEVHDVELK